MRYSLARFPFIVSFREKNPGDDEADINSNSIPEKPGEEIKISIRNNEEKLSLILRKMIFLESSLDEILEAKSLGNEEPRLSSLIEEEKLKKEKFFLNLIPILDSLEAACRAVAELKEIELSRGLEMINKKLVLHLSSWDFAQSAGLGIKFDPLIHEVVGTDSKSPEQDLITDIIVHGWMLNGKVLRFAKVIIAK